MRKQKILDRLNNFSESLNKKLEEKEPDTNQLTKLVVRVADMKVTIFREQMETDTLNFMIQRDKQNTRKKGVPMKKLKDDIRTLNLAISKVKKVVDMNLKDEKIFSKKRVIQEKALKSKNFIMNANVQTYL